MGDYRSMTRQPDLSGNDLVLLGKTVRDCFLTAYILQQSGFVEITRPNGERPPPSAEDALFLDLEATGLDVRDRMVGDREGEPLSINLVGGWFPDDDV